MEKTRKHLKKQIGRRISKTSSTGRARSQNGHRSSKVIRIITLLCQGYMELRILCLETSKRFISGQWSQEVSLKINLLWQPGLKSGTLEKMLGKQRGSTAMFITNMG